MTDIPIRIPWWRKRLWLGLLATSLLAAATAMTFPANAVRSVRRDAASLSFASVQRGIYRDALTLRCTVVPRDVIYLDAVEGGRVERVLVQPGDEISAGQVLVQLSNTELELEVLDRQARLIDSITQLQTYRTQLDQNHLDNEKALAQIDYDLRRLTRSVTRVDALADQGLLAREARDTLQEQLDHAAELRPLQARSNLQQSELRARQVPLIESQIAALQRDITMTRGKLDNLTVRAPRAGRMTAIDLKVGESFARGSRLGQMTPQTGFQLTARVDEYYLEQVAPGQRADLRWGSRAVSLRVERVHPEVREGTFAVELAFDEPAPAGLRPGQALQPRLQLGKDAPGLILTAGAFLETSGGGWAFVRRGPHRAERRAIKVGRHNAEQIEILAGLHAGDAVVVSDYSGLQHVDRIELE